MRKLVGKLNLVDPYGNKEFLKVFANSGEGTISYVLTNLGGMRCSISNLQCGWRGPLLPDNTYEYHSNSDILNMVKIAVEGGTAKVESMKVF